MVAGVVAAAAMSVAASYLVLPSPAPPTGWHVYYRNDPAVTDIGAGTDSFELTLDITRERYPEAVGRGPLGTYRSTLASDATYVLDFTFEPEPGGPNGSVALQVPAPRPGTSPGPEDLALGCEAGSSTGRTTTSALGRLHLNVTPSSCTYRLELHQTVEEPSDRGEIGWEVTDADQGILFQATQPEES